MLELWHEGRTLSSLGQRRNGAEGVRLVMGGGLDLRDGTLLDQVHYQLL